jgi:hypothetical protein
VRTSILLKEAFDDMENLPARQWEIKYLERISDHGIDIGERTIFLVSGERMEGIVQQYLDRNLDYDEEDV